MCAKVGIHDYASQACYPPSVYLSADLGNDLKLKTILV